MALVNFHSLAYLASDPFILRFSFHFEESYIRIIQITSLETLFLFADQLVAIFCPNSTSSIILSRAAPAFKAQLFELQASELCSVLQFRKCIIFTFQYMISVSTLKTSASEGIRADVGYLFFVVCLEYQNMKHQNYRCKSCGTIS